MARPALSAARAVDVLNFLASHPDESFTLSDLVRRLGINVASLHAVLAVLAQAGYVRRDPQRRAYSTGPMLVPLGQAARRRHGALSHARSALRALVGDLGVTGLVVGATAGEMVILDEVAPGGAAVPAAGQRIEMVAPMGGVFLAGAGEDRIDAWIATGPAAVRAERDALSRWLAAIRERGYAVGLETDARQELRRAVRALRDAPGSRSERRRLRSNVARLGDVATVLIEPDPLVSYPVAHVASPVRASGDDVALALYLVGFRRRLTAYEIERIGERLRDAACLPEPVAAAPVAGSSALAEGSIW